MLGIQELVMLLAIGLVLFGGSKAPDMAKKLGQTVKDTKDAFKIDNE